MRQGIYTIDSIEKGMAKLLWRKDESIEEIVAVEELGYSAKEGDILTVSEENGQSKFTFMQDQTELIKDKAKKLKEELLRRSE